MDYGAQEEERSRMRRLSLAALMVALASIAQGQTDWPMIGHDAGGTRYSPLKQINSKNVSKLQQFHDGKVRFSVAGRYQYKNILLGLCNAAKSVHYTLAALDRTCLKSESRAIGRELHAPGR
jgi:glucose dehydrogenase